MATFVVRSDEKDQIIYIAEHIVNIERKRDTDADKVPNEEDYKTFSSEMHDLVESGKISGALDKIINKSDVLFISLEKKNSEVEGVFSTIFSLIMNLDSESSQKQTENIINAITSSKESDDIYLRLKILTNLFSMYPTDSTQRVSLFQSITQFSLDTGKTDVILPHVLNLKSWMKEWNLTNDDPQISKLHKLAHTFLSKDGDFYKESIKELQYYLESFNGKADFAETTESAVKLIQETITLEDFYEYDHLLQIDAIKILAKDSTHSNLYDLLTILASGSLDDLYSFLEKNAKFLESMNLDKNCCENKMRLLTLTSIAQNDVVSYSEISETLRIPIDEVEDCIIEGLSSGLLKGKMNQVEQAFYVTFSHQRNFDEDQWKLLGSKLQEWQENITNLNENLRESLPPIESI